MTKKKKIKLKVTISIIGILMIYPVFILSYTYYHVMSIEFPGGRNGPRDAYRHSLASATVSYTIGEWAVQLVSSIMEVKGSDSNEMDLHNNMIGSSIGKNASSFFEIEPAIKKAVQGGAENAQEPGRITWLSSDRWGNNWAW